MYPPHHLGGYELMWRSAVSRLRARGHQVRILTTGFRLDSPDPTIAEDEDVHRELRWYWRDHEFPSLGIGERMRLERHNAGVLERQLADFRPDVVGWWAMGGMSLSLVERVRRDGRPATGVVIDDWMVYGPQVDGWLRLARRLGPASRLMEALSGVPATVELGASGEWVFVSERTRRAAAAAGWTLPRTSVAHGGVDPARFEPVPPHSWSWRLLYVGRIDPRKGIETALRAIAELPEAYLTVVGSGDPEHLRSLRALAAELGIENRVDFTHRDRDGIPQAYAAADAVLFPVQWEEPWGLVPLEAMASGRPVVATGAGGSGEYLRDGENCLIFSPRDDPAALAAAVERLAADEPLRTTLRAGGLRTVARYTEDAFNDAVVDAIERAR
jgi:glycosyltransferase involved in cell wall biosynthesis